MKGEESDRDPNNSGLVGVHRRGRHGDGRPTVRPPVTHGSQHDTISLQAPPQRNARAHCNALRLPNFDPNIVDLIVRRNFRPHSAVFGEALILPYSFLGGREKPLLHPR